MNAQRPIADEFWPLLDAACGDELTAEQWAELQSHLESSPAARRAFIDHIRLRTHIRQWWKGERSREAGLSRIEMGLDGEGRGMAGSPAIDVSVGAAVQLPRQPKHQPGREILGSEPLVPPVIILSPLPSSLSPSFVGGPVFSYMVATVILGMMLLGAWAYKITHFQQVAEAPAVPSSVRPELVFVGRITGMLDCKWSDPQTEAFAGASVPLGRKYALASGLMKISYHTGAKVILEGPCTYEVESRRGGYLALGKLTARLEKDKETRRQGGKERLETGGRKSDHYPLSTIHYPLFSVRTPTALITDLGTEFGVEVSSEGNTTSHVFQGKVKVQLFGGDGKQKDVVLHANESARVEIGSERIAKVDQASLRPDSFFRQMPKRVRINAFNTGVGLNEGDADPHWQIVAVSNDPGFKPRPAVVTWAGRPSQFCPNDSARSQWISTADRLPDLPDGVTYTFRTTFELTDVVPGSAKLRGGFLADNHVKAVRLNGVEIPTPEHGYTAPFYAPHRFIIGKGFVEGTNVLEIGVLNGVPGKKSSGVSPMALLVELEGSILSVVKGDTPGVARQSNAGPNDARAEETYMQAILADKPLGYWPLNESASARKFRDRSGNGFHGTAMGNVRAGQEGPLPGISRAIELEGNGYIDLGLQDRFALKNNFTVEAWMWAEGAMWTGDRMRYGQIISAGSSETRYQTSGWGLSFRSERGRDRPVCCYSPYGHEHGTVVENVEAPPARWIHLVLAIDENNTAKVYVNGVLRSSQKTSGAAKTGPTWLSIGYGSNLGGQYWHGRLAHVAVYPTALDDQHIQNHFRQAKTSFDN